MKPFNIEEVKEFIRNSSPDTKVYIGSDSERSRIDGEWYADFCTAVVVHIDGNKGCKVFGKVERERDYDRKMSRPQMRMMTECYKASEMYLALADVLVDREVEIHLDLNTDEAHGSHCALQQAVGYIRGTCNIVPKVKPEAPAASFCADRLKHILAGQQEREAA
jgi:predicted RNase H-related nuclease YkuK (DUF458 family)